MREKAAKMLRKLACSQSEITVGNKLYISKVAGEIKDALFGKITYEDDEQGEQHMIAYPPRVEHTIYCTGVRELYKKYKKLYKQGQIKYLKELLSVTDMI